MHHQPSGLSRALALIDPNWSPEQAMAVIDLLDDLRNVIWARYELALLQIYHEQLITEYPCDTTHPDQSNEPF